MAVWYRLAAIISFSQSALYGGGVNFTLKFTFSVNVVFVNGVELKVQSKSAC